MALTTKQKLFCYYYIKLGNIKESAIQSGFPKLTALYEGTKILASKQGRDYISRLTGNLRCDGTENVDCGLSRLAFGSVNDAVSLIFADDEKIDISTLDLFNISEIKRQKGGAVEVKFFDRLKALETLYEIRQRGNTDAAKSFFDALKSSATTEDISDNAV